MKKLSITQTLSISGGKNNDSNKSSDSVDSLKDLSKLEYPLYSTLNKMCVHNERTDDRRITVI